MKSLVLEPQKSYLGIAAASSSRRVPTTPGIYEVHCNNEVLGDVHVIVPSNNKPLYCLDDKGQTFEPCDSWYSDKQFFKMSAVIQIVAGTKKVVELV